jgi:hypothetical protein
MENIPAAPHGVKLFKPSPPAPLLNTGYFYARREIPLSPLLVKVVLLAPFGKGELGDLMPGLNYIQLRQKLVCNKPKRRGKTKAKAQRWMVDAQKGNDI